MGPPPKSKISDITRIEESSKESKTQWVPLTDTLISSIQSAKDQYPIFWNLDSELDRVFQTKECGLEVQDYYLEKRTCFTVHQMYSFHDSYTECIAVEPVKKESLKEVVSPIEKLKKEIVSDIASLKIDISSFETEVEYSSKETDCSSASTGETNVDSSVSSSVQSRISSPVPKTSRTNVIYCKAEEKACCEILLKRFPQQEGQEVEAVEILPEDYEQLQQAGLGNMDEEMDPDEDGSSHENSERQQLSTEEKMETADSNDDNNDNEERSLEDPNYFCFNVFLDSEAEVLQKLSNYRNHFTLEEFQNSTNLRTFLEKVQERSLLKHLVNLSQKLIWQIKKGACDREIKLREKRYKAWKESNFNFVLERHRQLLDLKNALKASKEQEQKRLQEEVKKLIRKLLDLRELLRKKDSDTATDIDKELPKNELEKVELTNFLIDQCFWIIKKYVANLNFFYNTLNENGVTLSQSLQSESEDEEKSATMEGMESLLIKVCMEKDVVLWNQQQLIQTFIKVLYVCASIEHPELSDLAKDTLKILKRPKTVRRHPSLEDPVIDPSFFHQKLKFKLAKDRPAEVLQSSDTLAGTEEITEECQNPLECTSTNPKVGSMTSSLQLPESDLKITVKKKEPLSPMEERLDVNDLEYIDDSSKDEVCKSMLQEKNPLEGNKSETSKTKDPLSPPEKKLKK